MINKQTTTKFSPGATGAASGARAFDDAAPNGRRGTGGASGGGDEPGVGSIWADVRATLRRQLGDSRFENWIAKLELVAEVNGEILVSRPRRA